MESLSPCGVREWDNAGAASRQIASAVDRAPEFRANLDNGPFRA